MNSRFSSNLFCNETETGDKTNEVEVLNKKANLLIPFQQAPVAQWIEHRIPERIRTVWPPAVRFKYSEILGSCLTFLFYFEIYKAEIIKSI